MQIELQREVGLDVEEVDETLRGNVAILRNDDVGLVGKVGTWCVRRVR